MELRVYLRILFRKWWIVLSALLITFVATVVFTFAQTPKYKATATFVVAPDRSLEDGGVYGLDTLSRQTEINNTYAEVAISHLIRQRAADELKLSPDQMASATIDAQPLAGTNLIKISALGDDPVLVRHLANTVGIETVAYMQELYEIYTMKLLDEAALPTSPEGRNEKLNLVLGAALGLVLGGGLAFLSEYLQTPLESAMSFDILDGETGAYNERYLRQRLGEEMSRARRSGSPLSLALMNIDCLGSIGTSHPPQVRGEALRRVAAFLKRYLREEDVLARLDGTTFAFLLPDTSEESAKAMMEELQAKLDSTSFEIETSGAELNLSGAAGVAACQNDCVEPGEFLAEVSQALRQAESSGCGKVCALSDLRQQRG
jgi:diguanylate cyclase (GGDEF)-like protein